MSSIGTGRAKIIAQGSWYLERLSQERFALCPVSVVDWWLLFAPVAVAMVGAM